MSGLPSSSASRRASNTGSARRVEVDSEESETENGTGTPQRQTTTNGRGRQTSDGVEVTPRRTPLKSANSKTLSESKSQKSGASRRATIVEEIDENDVPQSSNGAGTPTASMKKRRLSKSGRASVIPEPETAASAAGSGGEDDEATPPPPSTRPGKSDWRTSKIPSSARRVEVEDDEDAEPALNGSDNEAEEQKAVKKQAKLIRDHKDGYVMGSVVRIKCVNFLTYSNAECHPGPSLNMIIGPNGSGKSTVAAAIAIGLGYPPKVMGRSNALKNFVRENEKEGHVEIELKGKPGHRNMVVKRYLNSSDNTSKFEINGRPALKEAVTEAVAGLNVNVNNLCSFLPQDRVKEFAQLSGAELLKETQRVVDPRLLVRQEQLVKLKERSVKANKELERNEEELTEKDRKLKAMDKDVKRYKERKVLEQKALIQEVCLPYMQYIEAKARHDRAKRDKNNAREKIDQLNQQNAPLVNQKDALSLLIKETERRFKAITKRYNDATRAQTNIESSINANEADVDKLRGTLKLLKETELKRKKDLADTEASIVKLQKIVSEGPPPGVPAELLDKLRNAGEKLRFKGGEIQTCSEVHHNCLRDIDNAHREKKRFVDSLEALNDVYKRREDQCMKEDQKLWAATKWARSHKQDFKGQVFDPIRLLVSVKDKRHAKLAEAAINYNQFKTILTYEKDDYNTLANAFTKYRTDRGEVDLRVNIAQLEPEQRILANYRSPLSQEELQALGFDCYVIDLIDGPEEVLAYLCQDANVHRIPVAFDNGQRIQHERLKQPGFPISRYITHNVVTSITFSRYGNKAPIVQDMPTREPRIFSETIDQNRKRELEMRVAEADGHIRDLQASRDEQIAKDQALRVDFDTLKAAKIEIENEKKAIEEVMKKFARRGVELTAAQNRQAQLLAQPSEELRRQKISKDLAKLAVKRLKAARRLPDCAGVMIKCQTAQGRVATVNLQASADHNMIDTSIKETNEEMTEAQETYRAANTLFAGLKVTAKELWNKADEEKRRIPDELLEEFQEQVENQRPVEDVAKELEALRAELSMAENINPGIIEKFEKLTEAVGELKEKVTEQRNARRAANDSMHQLMLNWVDPVKAIIETVNRNFSRAMESFGCAGEVSLNSEDEDYSKWSVKIMVAFRDAEDLTELTAHRQSGGERSLTTMTYLIALLELSQVPFSMVDEINQGMDGRAERAIHDTLVRAVCNRGDMGQYFLLTPKLLTGLTYADNMKILVVNNGDWLPEHLPLRNILSRRLAAKRQG